MTFLAPPFTGPHHFLDAPRAHFAEAGDASIGFVGVPYDLGVTNRPGARNGPNAIRAASKMLCEPIEGLVDFGDLNVGLLPALDMLNTVSGVAQGLAEKRIYPVFAGGDHSITLGILRGLYKVYGPIRLIHLDAHPDTWDQNWGNRYGHGSFLFHAISEGLIIGEESALLGVRCALDQHTSDYTNERIGTVWGADCIIPEPYAAMKEIIAEIVKAPSLPTYLTIDIDVIDPSQAPGTGTPEIAGLSTHWVKFFLELIDMRRINWVGMDVTEVNPTYDVAEITALAAATFIYSHLANRG